MTEKRRVQIRKARIITAETIWPGRCNVDDLVLVGELASEHTGSHVRGVPGDNVRTSLIIKQDLANRLIETKNTVYEVVE